MMSAPASTPPKSAALQQRQLPDIPTYQGERWPWVGGDLQTLRDWMIGGMPHLAEGTELILPQEDGDQLTGIYHQPERPAKAVLLIVHGLGGSAQSQHVAFTTSAALAAGYVVMRVNLRGAGSSRPLCRQSYNARRGMDIIPFIEEMKQRHSDLPVFLAAFSLGGTAALNMVAEAPDKAGALSGMISVSAPLDMVASNRQFHLMRNRPYVRYILSALQQLAQDTPDLAPHYIEAALRARTISDFDEYVTAPLAGYQNAQAYYQAASMHDRLADISLPLLLIHADNDPWIPSAAYRHARLGPNMQLHLTRGGGHVGFHQRQGRWYIKALLSYCDQLHP